MQSLYKAVGSKRVQYWTEHVLDFLVTFCEMLPLVSNSYQHFHIMHSGLCCVECDCCK